MSVGATVRRSLGRLERPVSDVYRSIFLDTRELASIIGSLEPADRILEVGVGDGILAQRISEELPASTLLGIDIGEHPGLLFSGDATRVTFRTVSAEDLRAEGPEPFDLVLVSDVLHHVAVDRRASVVAASGSLVAPGGLLVIKESVRVASIGYPLCVIADRWIGGDRSVAFLTVEEIDALVELAVGGTTPIARRTVRPWGVNAVSVYRVSPLD